ncbi:HAD-IA family hydrolase [Naasia aerilata]|uniref:Phosphatase n=1 Tax=Naasia aerilata TaxID=1162966 RepID=A0ABN6XM94_9MICO|nr:HAD-IA family hydrolase [Naasia aerilata]BDZ44513.1 phosphatase [Naasia aerilata]
MLSAHALLFDMDGTLVDSTAVVEVAWGAIADRFGVDREVMLPTIHGVRAEESIRRWAPPGTDIDAVVADLSAAEIASSGETIALPGAVEFLNAVPVERHALVTSAELPLAVARMAGAGLRLPQFVVTAEDVPQGKPAPDVYLLAARMLGVEPRDAVVFEDAEAGIRAGLAAGMRVVVVGDHESESTRGLPRITDYAGAGVTAGPGGALEVVLPHRP